MKSHDNDVYFIGNKKRVAWLWYAIFIVCTAIGAILACWLNYENSQKYCQDRQELKAVEVLPDNATPPKFNGLYDFGEFTKWLAANIKYPEGLETVNAKVVITFLITKEGNLTNIEVVAQPEQQEFAKQVVDILETCPQWAPGKLADGTPTDISYTLPINFNNTKHFE